MRRYISLVFLEEYKVGRGKLHSYLNYKWPKCFQFLLCVWGIPSNKLVKFSKTSTYFMSLRY